MDSSSAEFPPFTWAWLKPDGNPRVVTIRRSYVIGKGYREDPDGKVVHGTMVKTETGVQVAVFSDHGLSAAYMQSGGATPLELNDEATAAHVRRSMGLRD